MTDEAQPNANTNACLSEPEAIRKLISNAIQSNERHKTEDRTLFRVTLEEAVEVLSDIKVDDDDNSKRVGSMYGGKREYRQHYERQYQQ